MWLLLLAFSFAFVLNSHYLGLLLGLPMAFFWFLTALSRFKCKKPLKSFYYHSILALAVFIFLMSPLLIFDIRHNWINFLAIEKFFTERQTTISARPWNALPEALPLWQLFTTRILAGRNETLGNWTALALLSSLFIYFKFPRKQQKATSLIFVWLGSAIIGLGVYKQHIYDHYFGFFFPAMFLLLAAIFQYLLDNYNIRGKWLVTFSMLFLSFYNLRESPLNSPPARQMQRAVAVAQKIKAEAGDDKFNLAVIADRNYEDGYQYFLEKWNTNVVDIDPLNYEKTLAENLFVVCEKLPEDCDPTHSAKAEVANFGWSKVEEEWNVQGTTIFKLVHTKKDE